MKCRKNYSLHLILIVLTTLLILPLNSFGEVTNNALVMPSIIYLLLEQDGIQPVTDYDNDSFSSSVDCNDQANSCTTDCTDSDGDAVSDCLDLCIDNDFDGYGIDNSASSIGSGAVSVSECTVYGSDPCILNEACYGSDCNDSNPDIYPTNNELCDGLDNDCDGQTDESFSLGNACGFGECAGGIEICSPDGFSTICSTVSLSTEEACNGLDDDCDGQTDEGCTDDPCDPNPCSNPPDPVDIDEDGAVYISYNNPGTCEPVNEEFTCYYGETVVDCDDDDPNNFPGNTEVCDGQDNDCDPASADGSEDPQNATACDGPDSDLCVEGTRSCVAGVLVCSDNTSSTLDVCDGADNDCDPASADGSEDSQDGTACDTGLQGVCAAGTTNCVSGSLTCTANTSPSVEICNGLDDNCDGQPDEGCDNAFVSTRRTGMKALSNNVKTVK